MDIQTQVMGGAVGKILFVKRLISGLLFYFSGLKQLEADQFGFHCLANFP